MIRDYLETLLSEKGISLYEDVCVEGASGTNIMTVEIIVEHIAIAPEYEQNKIKDMLVKIDFKNGDILHYLKHLAQALAR